MFDDAQTSVYTRLQIEEVRTVMPASLRSQPALIESKLDELIRLPIGWDGGRAKPVAFRNARYACELLSRICEEKTRIPSVVPGYRGDLQLEWHAPNFDVEIHIVAPLEASLWCTDVDVCPDGLAISLNEDVTKAKLALQRISNAFDAAHRSAA